MLILLAGDPGTGKSVSAATAPKPILWEDWDDGFSSVRNTRAKGTTTLVNPDWEKEIDVVSYYRSKVHDLSFKTTMGGKGAPGFTEDSPTLINRHNDLIRELDKTGMYTYKERGPRKYKTLVVDSLTQFFHVWRENTMRMNNQSTLQVQDYMTLQTVMLSMFIPSLKRLDKSGVLEYIILIDHIDHDKDEITGAISEFPIGPSRAQGRLLGGQFDELWLQQEQSGVYQWRTRPFGLFKAKSRLDLPDPVTPATFTQLATVLAQRGGVK